MLVVDAEKETEKGVTMLQTKPAPDPGECGERGGRAGGIHVQVHTIYRNEASSST